MRKLLNRKIIEQGGKCAVCHEAFSDYSDPCRITEIPKAWAELGETTIPRTSKQSIGCAIQKKARDGLTTDDQNDSWHDCKASW